MKTAERRDRLLHHLYRQATTVPAIAQMLGVSDRTVYRDIIALRDAGHDIQATSGRGGGVRIAPDSRPRPVHFEVAEIVALALSVAILRATPNAPFAEPAQAALDRARLALSPERRRAMRRLEERVLVGAPASEGVQRTLGPVDPALLSVFERCFTGSRSMVFGYLDADGQHTTRHVECVALVLHAPTWYILAWDLDKDAKRLFRMDRIRAPASGDVLTAHHPLEELMPEVDPSEDRWQRRSLASTT